MLAPMLAIDKAEGDKCLISMTEFLLRVFYIGILQEVNITRFASQRSLPLTDNVFPPQTNEVDL